MSHVRHRGTVDVNVRVAGHEDGGKLSQLRRSWALEQGAGEDDDYERRFLAWYALEQRQRRFWLAELNGQPIGMVNLLLFDRMPEPGAAPSRWGYLANMFVLEEHRDHQVGSTLLAAALDWADTKGLDRVVLNPTVRSRLFYERHQFAPAAELMLRSRQA